MDRVLKRYTTETLKDDGGRTTELEVRFTNNGKPLSKTDYDNIIKRLLGLGFTAKNKNGNHSLRINTFTAHRNIPIRTEINDFIDIKDYCKTNQLNDNAKFITKTKIIEKTDIEEYGITLNLSEEKQADHALVKHMKEDDWEQSYKTFRYMNRIQLVHEAYPVFVDCSIVRSSKLNKEGQMIQEQSIAGALKNFETYEVEIEIDNVKAKNMTVAQLNKDLSKCIKFVLCGIQHTNYPIPSSRMKTVVSQYFKLVDQPVPNPLKSKYFIGPNSVTLQHEHLSVISENYSVTDKADGLRKLLFIDSNGDMYFITSSMEIEFTNINCPNKECFNTILDGEHITTDKQDKPINLYACFDLYFNQKKDYRALKFIDDDEPARFTKLKSVVENIIEKIGIGKLSVNVKFFAHTDTDATIQTAIKAVDENEERLAYHTDGYIFTPMKFGVGLSPTKKTIENQKITWDMSFKWKPPEQNTIDFLVTTLKDENGKEVEKDYFVPGTGNKIAQKYKTLLLEVGMNVGINPCNSLLHNTKYQRSEYKRVKFYPTNPSDERAHICNRLLNGDNQFVTDEKTPESFEDQMIVEFRYNDKNPRDWNWVPIRVRWDKTAEFRNKNQNYGNDYKTANNNWHSIHSPIGKEMLIQEGPFKGTDAYYMEHVVDKKNIVMRQFHNYIKRCLIKFVAKDGNTLIDFAVGKAGDLHKWSAANLSFVLGIDLSKDCIENIIDGACLRYMEYKEKNPKKKMDALFFHGDSSKNVRTGAAVSGEKERNIIKAKTSGGFDISSSQFSLHYFFKDKQTLAGFIQNVKECTKFEGYFIGTCFDGATVFELLASKSKHDMTSFGEICQIEKLYDADAFPNNDASLGFPIKVYNQTIVPSIEYLVNFQFFTDEMRRNGFELLKFTGSWPSTPSETFRYVFRYLEKHGKNEFSGMTEVEKQVSFMNRYFIFKKVSDQPEHYPIEKLPDRVVLKTT
jgi:hypothetical protein